MLALSIATLLGRRPPAEVPAEFSPSTLFANSEVGVWYDPSDFSTLYQDTAGTTPVTAVEQPVGKMLDKSGNGFHATAANNGTARPVLRSRYNLLTYSEQFDNAGWTKVRGTITATTETAPDGTSTADILTQSAGETTLPLVYRNTTIPNAPASTEYTFSVYAKAGTKTFAAIGTDATTTPGSNVYSFFNLSTGAVASSGAGHTCAIENVGSGWYRISLACTTRASVGNATWYFGSSNSASTSVTDDQGTLYIWGAQLVADSVFPSNVYQRIEAAPTGNGTVTYATGADFLPYLAFTTDDAMSTASIDFSATDEMSVFAGVTKNSDAAVGVLAELSAVSTNAGAFGQSDSSGPTSPNRTYGFRSESAVVVSSPEVLAPTTYVSASQADRAAPSIVIRRNGTQVGSTAASHGVGNYGNYPLYIGARDNSLFFFNGSLYSLIVRGKTSTAQEIDDTEAWVANKTGVTL